MLDLQDCCSEKCLFTVPWCFLLFFIGWLSFSNHLQKGEKLPKGVNKLVGKVSINLLHHAKSTVCIIR